MGVKAAQTKGADASETAFALGSPFTQAVIDKEGAAFQRDVGVWLFEMQHGWHFLVAQGHGGFDHRSETGSGVDATDIGLERAESAEVLFVHVAEGLSQTVDLDGVADF